MRADHLPHRSDKPRFIKYVAPLLLIIPSAIIGVLLVEVLYQLFFHPTIQGNDNSARRVVFLDGRSTIVRNVEDIFTYTPHNEIRNVTAFFSDTGSRH
jgi:hypothetical protein